MADDATAIVIVNVLAVGVVFTSKVFVVKSAATNPEGAVTLVNVNKSPDSKLCAVLLTVTVVDPLVVLKVQLVKAVPNGVIS